MNKTQTIIAALSSLLVGIMLFLYTQEIIIIRTPFFHTPHDSSASYKKQAPLFFWSRNRWNMETKELIWGKDLDSNMAQLLSSFLELMQEERVSHKKIMVQSVLIPPQSRIAYVSFDRCPFAKDETTYNKWMYMESILKTIRHNVSTIDAIQFLVAHAPLQDQHLDFSKSWPIAGFFKELQ